MNGIEMMARKLYGPCSLKSGCPALYGAVLWSAGTLAFRKA